jgi:hypothetical protein
MSFAGGAMQSMGGCHRKGEAAIIISATLQSQRIEQRCPRQRQDCRRMKVGHLSVTTACQC